MIFNRAIVAVAFLVAANTSLADGVMNGRCGCWRGTGRLVHCLSRSRREQSCADVSKACRLG
jgi:hypothetical protein